MAIDTTAPISRRGLLAAAFGGTAVAIAAVASRAERAFAAGSDGENIVIGETYDDVRSTTILENVANAQPVLRIVRLEDSYKTTVEIGGSPSAGGGGIQMAQSGDFGGGSVSIDGRRVSASTLGKWGGGTAVSGTSGDTGVSGKGDRVGVVGEGQRGGVFIGHKAPVQMSPSNQVSHPARGRRGDFFVDKSGRLWFCKGNRNWKQVA